MTAVDDERGKARRLAWVRRFIAAAPAGLPLYGSEAWLVMPDGRDKWVAVLRYAEGSLTALEDDLQRLRDEHLGAALEAKRAEDAAWVAAKAEHRRSVVVSRRDGRAQVALRRDPTVDADVERDWHDWVARGHAELLAEGALRTALVHGDPIEIEEAAVRVEQLERRTESDPEVAA